MGIDERWPLACLDGRAQRIVRAARAYADTLRSPVIGAEHLLLALLTDRRCRAARAVAALSDRAARAVGEPLVPGDRPSPRHLAFTITSEQAMVRAARAARALGDARIGTEHLLLGVLRAIDDPAVRRLTGVGVTYQTVHAEITRFRAA